MNDERWEGIKIMAENFEIIETGKIDLDESQRNGTKEFLIFKGPLGKIKLEYIVKPVVLETKTHYSRRAGQETKIEQVVSDTEKVRTLLAFKWNESSDDWEEMDASQFE